MDESKGRQAVDAHARAVVDGDMDHVVGDFAEELRPQVPELAKLLPQPVTDAEVRSFEVEGDQGVAHIHYSNADSELTIRTVWQERGGQPQIVEGAPVE
ncbi:MAG TPA: hypothetical protein VGI54_06220 [Solirubrobacteraceae bacterium]